MKIDLNELSFAGFAEEANRKIEESRQRSKESPLDENLRKVIIDYIYNNIINVANGQPLDHSLADINPECQQIIEALSAFEAEQRDLFDFFRKYNLVKGKFKFKQNLNNETLDKIYKKLISEGFGKEYMILGVATDILSQVIKKDVIMDMIARNNLEKTATNLTSRIIANENDVLLYSSVMGEMNNIIDKYGSLINIKKKLAGKNTLVKIKKEIADIADKELNYLESGRFEYGKMLSSERDKHKARLQKIKELDALDIFDVDNYGYIGLLLERRHDDFSRVHDDYENIGKRINKYLP